MIKSKNVPMNPFYTTIQCGTTIDFNLPSTSLIIRSIKNENKLKYISQ